DWIPYRDQYLDELLRREGLGDDAESALVPCALCKAQESTQNGEFRCLDCYGTRLLCQSCIVEEHKHHSLHSIQRWNGLYFERASLRSLGLSVHLGHHGKRCPNVGKLKEKLIVCETNGFHEVDVYYCLCTSNEMLAQLLRHGWYPATHYRINIAFTFRVLDLFHELTLQGKLNLHDFHKSLGRITDNSGVTKPPNVYKRFAIVLRQWRNLHLLKRSGRGHDARGITATKEGDCAVECPACPHPGRNLPADWASASPNTAWLYVLYLMLDANFRLKSKDRSFKDVGLSEGWSYFVENTKYQKFISKMGDQQERNTCSVEHKAIRDANVKHNGYLASGVAACLCNRHLLVRANGLADLQKGERYCTIDYILLGTLIGTELPLFISYDIACQYSKNFGRRVTQFPPYMQLAESRVVSIQWAIPKKHWYAHGEKGHSQLSLNYIPNAGRTYGEGVETFWAYSNPISMSIKEMAADSREETVDDHTGSWNHQKRCNLGVQLRNNLRHALVMKARHEAAFTRLSDTFSTSVVAEWQRIILSWEADPRSVPDPFVMETHTMTLNEIRLKLAREESDEMIRGIPSLHEVSASAFLEIGLDIENLQCTLASRAKNKNSLPDLINLQAKRNGLLHRIDTWRKIQMVYIPVASSLINDCHDSDDDSGPGIEPEIIPLFLPSSIPENLRSTSGLQSLITKESQLRVAIADDSLMEIRHLRQALKQVTQFKHLNISGSGGDPNTRIRTMYDKYNDKVTLAADRYRRAYTALKSLDPLGNWSQRLKPLADKDISGPGRDDDETTGEGYREISWIWLTQSSTQSKERSDKMDDVSNEIMRVEWMKSRARSRRWAEEVQLLQEEMRRTVVFLEWKASWWRDQIRERCYRTSLAIARGLAAYAEKQASNHEKLAQSFLALWKPFFDEKKLSAPWLKDRVIAVPQPIRRRGRRGQTSQEDIDSGDESSEEENDGY
ncbi:hypothetical protein BC629DRAFT_1293606, partial [Irpex lacteus]